MTFVLKLLTRSINPVHLNEFVGAESKYECPRVSTLHVLQQNEAYSLGCMKPNHGDCAQTAHA